MRVVLKQFMPNLGKRDDIVDVKDGYARNYLLPEGIAELATPEAVQATQERRERQAQEQEERRTALEEAAEALAGATIRVTMAADEEGTLYGSIGIEEIATALRDDGHDIPDEAILLPEPIKEVGAYEVSLALAQDLEIAFTLAVERSAEE